MLPWAAPVNTPNFGSNVYVFNPSMSSTNSRAINAVYNTQQTNEMGTQRYALLFTPGTYNVDVPVGFYTQVLGLGQSPTQTTITGGGVHADANWNGGNATINFWRDAENLTTRPVVRQHRLGNLAGRPRCAGWTSTAISCLPPRQRLLVVRRLHRRLGGHRPGQLRQPAAVHPAQRPVRQLDRLELEHGVRR